MTTTELAYPIFQANQVLTNAHLNALFEYLDGQERLTRANLIGVGIGCGLAARLEDGAIHLSKGCGVTSQGYLIVQPDDVALVSWRTYTLPSDPPYPPLVDPATKQQYKLWELCPADEPGTQPLSGGGLDLAGKAVVLLLELRKDDLRNCSQNSCDDRGAEVTATVRRLLIDVVDLDKSLAARAAETGLVTADLAAEVAKRLQLPDLRLPRFDVPNSGAVSSDQVLAAFQAAFRQDTMAKRTGEALTALYTAFGPLVGNDFPENPFAEFLDTFGFLDRTPASAEQVRFMQYYWDLFDDLIDAYDDVRWQGVDLMCACCPPEDLFPRHLMAGALAPSTLPEPDAYRHRFLPSPAVGDCERRGAEVLLLFRRLVAMVESFTNTPSLPAPGTSVIDTQIRVTPSRLGDVPLSAKAIPYYYEQGGTPPLFELWDPGQSARRRPNQNLSYRADEYRPAAPSFVTDPLRFDLEPNDFLRVEGHLGKDVQSVLNTLLTLRESHRLPIDVIALRTGAFDENIPIDVSIEDCRFDDLETLYATLRAELTCFLCEEVQYFYHLPLASEVPTTDVMTPSLQLLRTCAPDFLVESGTLGRWIERRLRGGPQLIDGAAFQFSLQAYELVEALVSLYGSLGDDIRRVDFAGVTEHHRHLLAVAESFEAARRAADATAVTGFAAPGLADRLDDILFRCRLDPFEALVDEYTRRVRDVKQARFLGNFLDKHPGIQHKAGVPLGGTFILVYHEAAERLVSLTPPPIVRPFGTPGAVVARPPEAVVVEPASPEGGALHRVDTMIPPGSPAVRVAANTVSGGTTAPQPQSPIDLGITASALAPTDQPLREFEAALARLALKTSIAGDPDVQLIFQRVTGKVLVPRSVLTPAGQQVFLDAVAGMANGTVIADFFLPYLCCSDRPPIQYTLPPRRIRLGVSVACTNADGIAEVTVTPDGATGAVSVQVDGDPFEELTGKLLLPVGTHTIVLRDDSGAESVPTPVTISPPIAISAAQTVLDPAGDTYHVVFNVSGGTPPYRADAGNFDGSAYTSPPVAVGATVTVTVRDAHGCTVESSFQYTLPPRRIRLGVSVACTNADGIAEVTVTPDGATGAVSVQVDGDPFEELTGKLLLPVGTHTIVLRDDSGAESVPTPVTISQPIAISAAQTVLDPAGDTYHVVFNVSGGTPPYRADAGNFDGSAYTSPPVAVGATVTVTVRDAHGCTVESSFQHPGGGNPCGLPCDGWAIRRGHRFWLPEPLAEFPVDGYQAEVRTFRVLDPNSGQEFELTDDMNAVVGSAAAPLDVADFDEVVREWMMAINDRIAEAVGSDRWIQFEYQPPAGSSPEDPDASTPAPPRFGTLWIDRLECLELNFELSVEFVEQGKEHALEFGYGANGTALREPITDVDIVIPPFGGARSNKCRPEERTVPLCSDALPELAIDVAGTGPDQVQLSATVSGTDPAAYLWEVRDGLPAMSNEPVFDVQFDSTESRERLIRLTVFTQSGCTVMVERVINLDDPSG